MNHITVSESQLGFLVYGVLAAVFVVAALIFSRVGHNKKQFSNKTMANFATFLGVAIGFNVLMAMYLLGYSTADSKIILLIATVFSFYLGVVFFMYTSSYLFNTKPQSTIQKGIVY